MKASSEWGAVTPIPRVAVAPPQAQRQIRAIYRVGLAWMLALSATFGLCGLLAAHVLETPPYLSAHLSRSTLMLAFGSATLSSCMGLVFMLWARDAGTLRQIVTRLVICSTGFLIPSLIPAVGVLLLC